MPFCTCCGNEVNEQAVACPKCGVPPKVEKNHCYHCGEKLHNPNQALCVKCGMPITTAIVPADTALPPTVATQAVVAPTNDVFCTNCGNSTSERSVICLLCGANPLGHRIAHRKFCRRCGTQANPGHRLCTKCGYRIAKLKSRAAASIFALYLGGVGGHKFYMGSWGWGIFFLIFCWTFIPSIIAAIEFIWYLTTSDDSFAAAYPPETQSAWRW